jgi:DnaK suppressor protein
MKQDLLNRSRTERLDFLSNNTAAGDEIDQSVAHLLENQFLANQSRMRHQLLEIELALSRLANGSFGICEETAEMIEESRLLAIPYTRLSIEGAEIREAMSRRFLSL